MMKMKTNRTAANPTKYGISNEAYYTIKADGTEMSQTEPWLSWDKSTGIMTIQSDNNADLVDT